jgi:hypothetical protein
MELSPMVVIGDTLLVGGAGTVSGTLCGVLVLGGGTGRDQTDRRPELVVAVCRERSVPSLSSSRRFT